MSIRQASLCGDVDALTRAGRIADAYRLLTSREAAADAEALILLADWRLRGELVRRDLHASRELFRKAGELGRADARMIYAGFLASGTGGPTDWKGALSVLQQDAETSAPAKDELLLIERMKLATDGTPGELPREQQLSATPRASCFRGLFSRAECDFLIMRARAWLAPSLVVDPRTGRQMPNPVRTSDAMAFSLIQESPAIHALNRRIAAATGTDVRQGEPLQVLRYGRGQEYKPHSDALAREPNQRILTLLVYLNSGFEGGKTVFVKSGLSFRGEPGDALLFWNVTQAGQPDPLAVHAGLPVHRGEKLIGSRWIRMQPFSFPPPPPVLNI